MWYILGATWWILMSRQFRICMAKGGRESTRLSYGRSKLTLISIKKITVRGVTKNLAGRNFDFRAKSSRFLLHRLRWFFFSRNKGQLRAAVTRPCRLSTPLCHTYSEPSGHEDSPGTTQNITYLLKIEKITIEWSFFWAIFGGGRWSYFVFVI